MTWTTMVGAGERPRICIDGAAQETPSTRSFPLTVPLSTRTSRGATDGTVVPRGNRLRVLR
jgi:hypothetical protein